MSLFISGCITRTTSMVEMRDGVHLATDVYLPKNQNESHGVVLTRTPYNKNLLALVGIVYAWNGWPTVIQDMRGRYVSEGLDTLFRNDRTDGVDTLAWIGNQSWCNGKISTLGSSALGIAQYLGAGADPPELACQFIDVGTPNLYSHAIFHGGEFRKNLVMGWLEDQESMYILPEIYAHENYSLDFWSNVTLEDKWGNVNVPAIHSGGWYDIFEMGTIEGFLGYQHLGGPNAVGKSKLIIGPWTHTGSPSTRQGQLIYPENSVDTFSVNLFWNMTNQYTMNKPSGFDSWPAVMYYVMGDVSTVNAPGNEWRTADDWPIPATETSWYFHHDRVLNTSLPKVDDAFTYTYDPVNPVPTKGGQNLNMAAGPYDQSSVENRSDVLVFTSPVFTKPYEATGSVKARLFVSSDCPDTDFTVKLTDVYPDGPSMLIADGILRMRNRNGTDHWEFMQPGQIYEVEVDLWSTSYIWNTGHRIRVDVSSSNYPRFLNNPNNRDGIMQNTTYQIAHNTLYLDALHPSCLILPEIEQGTPSTPPTQPAKPSGTGSGKIGIRYTFVSNASDPNGDNVSLLFDWGDGTSSGWLISSASGQNIGATHVWKEKGSYNVRVKAKDTSGNQSVWSDSVDITIQQGLRYSKNVVLDRLAERYPVVRKVISWMDEKTN